MSIFGLANAVYFAVSLPEISSVAVIMHQVIMNEVIMNVLGSYIASYAASYIAIYAASYSASYIGNYLASYLASLISLLVFLVLLGWTIRVCAADARRRGKSPLLVTLLILVSFPFGLIAWLLFRPEPLDRNGAPPTFRLEDHRVQ